MNVFNSIFLVNIGHREPLSSYYMVLFFLLVIPDMSAQQFEEVEYCEAEKFRPACQRDEVVVIKSARYGRMKVGKCVRTDYGYVGCFADVRPHLDSKCSGRRSCELRIPDQELDDTKPCPTEFKTYLEASYTCVRVESSQCQSCQRSRNALVTTEKGYLASVVTIESELGCGSAMCPWRIELQPGQRINVTLYDFGMSASKRLYGLVDSCFRYAVIKEKGSRDLPICGGKERKKSIFLSKSNIIEIHIVSPEVFGQRGQFMFYYEAVGCPKLQAPKNSWAKREDQTITYGCLASSESWSMTCMGTVWDGTMRSCAAYGEVSQGPATVTLSMGVLIAIIVGIALVIGVFILTVGLVCLKRQQHNNFRRQDRSLYLQTRRESEYPEDIPAATLTLPYTKKEEIPEEDVYKPRPPPKLRENVYMESRPLPQIPSLSETEEDARSEKSSKVQVYRTSSGREHYHNPRLVITPRPTPPNSAEPREDPQYFVLDPDEMTIEQSQESYPQISAGCSSAMPPPPRRLARGGIQSDKQKSPEEENAENFCKEVSNTSCHDLPTTLQHYETSVDCHNHNGNSSWP